MKTKVTIAWSAEAARVAENRGFEAAKNRFPSEVTIKEFDTPEQARAYCEGIDDAAGCEQPFWNIANPNGIDSSYLVCHSRGVNLTSTKDDYSVFRAGEGNAKKLAQELYNNLLQQDDVQIACLCVIIESTDY